MNRNQIIRYAIWPVMIIVIAWMAIGRETEKMYIKVISEAK